MKRLSNVLVLGVVVLALSTHESSAHLTYSGRDFGIFAGGENLQTATISGQTVSGNFGWADAADADWGDSHRLRAFRFTLLDTALVTIQVTGSATGYDAIPDDPALHPAFSLYSGLAHVTPAAADHDGSVGSQTYLIDQFGSPHGKEGNFNALGNFGIGNDNDEVSFFTYIGHAMDADLDRYVEASFTLGPGDYTLLVGGNHYASQGPVELGINSANGSSYATYGVGVTLVVPEPGTAMLLALGALLGLHRERKCRL